MLSAPVENVTEMYLRDAEPCLTMMVSRPAPAYYRVVGNVVELPPWLEPKTDFASSETGTLPEIERPILYTAQSPADSAIVQLLRLEKLDADWDGNEAARPLDYSIKDARAFVRMLSPESIIPRATLHADGHAILFVREPDLYAELEFLGDNKIGFYARRGGEKWSEEFIFDGQSLPEGLSQIGFSL
jgi:hypothetical protein